MESETTTMRVKRRKTGTDGEDKTELRKRCAEGEPRRKKAALTPCKTTPTKTKKRSKDASTTSSTCEDESMSHSSLDAPTDGRNVMSLSVRPLLGGPEKKSKPSYSTRGVVLINRLPYGFAEAQLRRFFSQFGHITRLRLVRSRKTGGSKGYAFIEFELKEIAKIVAETMDNYLMFGVSMKCRLLAPEQVPHGVFRNYLRHPKRGANVDKQRIQHNKNGDGSHLTERRLARMLEKEKKRAQKFKEIGIDFKPPSIVTYSKAIKHGPAADA